MANTSVHQWETDPAVESGSAPLPLTLSNLVLGDDGRFYISEVVADANKEVVGDPGNVAPTGCKALRGYIGDRGIPGGGGAFVSYDNALAASVALPSFSAGDLAIVLASHSASLTIPSLPTGWTNIDTGSAGAGSVPQGRFGYRVLESGDTTTGTWTNAEAVQVAIYSGVNSIGTTGKDERTSSTTIISAPELDPLQITDGTAFVVAMCQHEVGAFAYVATMPGMTNRSGGDADTPLTHTSDQSSVADPFAQQTVGSGGSGRSVNFGAELIASGATATKTKTIGRSGNRYMILKFLYDCL